MKDMVSFLSWNEKLAIFILKVSFQLRFLNFRVKVYFAYFEKLAFTSKNSYFCFLLVSYIFWLLKKHPNKPLLFSKLLSGPKSFMVTYSPIILSVFCQQVLFCREKNAQQVWKLQRAVLWMCKWDRTPSALQKRTKGPEELNLTRGNERGLWMKRKKSKG